MVTADLSPTSLTVRAFTGVRQRVVMVLIAATLGLVTQGASTGLPPNGAQGNLNTVVEIDGESFRFFCRGSGAATVLFLMSDGPDPLPGWNEIPPRVSASARVCSLNAADGRARTAILTPDRMDRMADALDSVLAAQRAPAPYVIVAMAEWAPLVISFTERHAGLVNGGLVIEPASQLVTGWAIRAGLESRAFALDSVERVLLQIRSLIWPPRTG